MKRILLGFAATALVASVGTVSFANPVGAPPVDPLPPVEGKPDTTPPVEAPPESFICQFLPAICS